MAKQPISNYIYYTLAEALEASAKLGCGGYRTYVVDGVRVYLPCDDLATFEKLTSYTIVKGLIVANGNETFGGNLVGMQLTSNDLAKGDALFTMGNFSINTTVVLGKKEQPFVNPDPNTKANTAISLTKLNGSDAISKLDKIAADKTVTFNFSKTNFNRYTLFGSLSDKIKFSLIDISEKYPAAIKFRTGGLTYPTISKYSVNLSTQTTTFELSTSVIFNPFDIIYNISGLTTEDSELVNPLRNLTKYYSKYDFVYDGIRYDILSLGSISKNRGNITITISGLPFLSLIKTNGIYNTDVYIVPKREEYLRAMDSMSDMAKYLLNKKDPAIDEYSADFNVPYIDDNGNIIYGAKTLYFPIYDEYNLDMFSNKFENYLASLNDIANEFDLVKTNLVSRFLTTESLKEFDTDNRKVDTILKSYGKTFDTAKQYIDALAFMTRVSYDKIENIPDALLKNFARTIGWKTYEIEDENTIVESLFDLTEDPKSDKDITPAELDIQLWRRLLMNSAYLFKSKGTRKSVDTILQLVGVPDLIYEINEYVYVAQNKLDYAYYRNKLIDLSSYPIDSEGYPTTPINPYFQKGGGNIIQDSTNVGPYDFGSAYLAPYRKFDSVYAFDIYKTVDNRKSWVANSTTEMHQDINRLTDTNYQLKDSRLLINVKNLDVFISLDRIMDSRVYNHYKNGSIVLGNNSTKLVDATSITFNSFIRESLSNFIDIKNRKTIVTYPTLTKIYFDYVAKSKELGKNPIDYEISLSFLQKYDTYWVDLIRQFTPATALLTAGKKIANSKLNDNKYKYQHGQSLMPVTGEIDTTNSWLGTDGSEFQQVTLKPVVDGRVEMVKNDGTYKHTIIGTSESFDFNGTPKNSNFGYLKRSAYYNGNYYGLFESCQIDLTTITDQSYLDGVINFICPPPIPHVCYYSNNPVILPSTVFVNNYLSNNSTVTEFTTENTTANGIIIGTSPKVLYLNPPTSDEISASFVINKVLKNNVAGEDISIFVEFEYENMLLYTFNGATLTDSQLNPTLDLYFVDTNNTTISDIITIELKPTLYGAILDSNKVRFNALISCVTVGDIALKGLIKLDKLKSTDNLVRNTSFYDDASTSEDFDTLIPNGDGVIKILGFSIKTVPLYSDSVSTSSAFKKEWFAQKYFIQQPKYYGLTILDSDNELLAITDTNKNRLYTKDGWIGEYKTNTEEYSTLTDRVTVDPLMHIPTIYEKEFLVTDKNDVLTINLSQSLHLSHIFSPSYDDNGIITGGVYNENTLEHLAKRADNQEIDGKIYISDAVSIFYDGMYATNGTVVSGGPGPIYKIKNKPEITSHISGDILCPKGINTYIKLNKPSANFESLSDLIAINGSTTSYYQVNSKQLYKFKGELIFDSDFLGKQSVVIKLVDEDNVALAEQSGVFASSKNSNYSGIETRTISFDFNVFLDLTTRVYLVVKSIDADCYVKEYDEVDIEPQKTYDTNTFINIVPAKWNGFDKLYYNEANSIGLPGMFLSYGNNGYQNNVGNISKTSYLNDMLAFTASFRYAKDFYYDKIVFETTDEFIYKNITINDGVITINPDTTIKSKIQSFEYLPFYRGSVSPISGTINESVVGLINYSNMFDVSRYADFGTIELGKQTSPGLKYNVTTQATLAENERLDKIKSIFNTATPKSVIDPLDYAYTITGPFGLDGMKNTNNLYPFGLIDKASFVSGSTSTYGVWPYNTITTNEYVIGDGMTNTVSGITLNTTAIVGTNAKLLTTSAYDGALFIVKDDSDSSNLSTVRQLTTTSASGYTVSNNWSIVSVSGVKDYVFTPIQGQKPIIGDDSYLNIYNVSLRTAINTPLYLEKDSIFKLKNAFIGSSLSADGNTAHGYLPRGLSNTTIKYQKKSHIWVYGTVVQQFNNEMNLYSTSYREKSNGRIIQKGNARTLGSSLVKNIDNNGLFDYAFAKSGLVKASVQYGSAKFYNSGSDLIMEYKVDRDQSDFPITGEFIGRLTIKDICGNIATTILRLFIANNINTIEDNIIIPTETIEATPSAGTVTTTTTAITTPTVISRTLTLSVEGLTPSYGVNISISGSISGNDVFNDTILAGKMRTVNFLDNESITISYDVTNESSTVSSISVTDIGVNWVSTGVSGAITIPASKIISDFDIIFKLTKQRIRLAF